MPSPSEPVSTPVPADPVRQRRTAGPHGRRRRLAVLVALVAVVSLVGSACKQLDPANRSAPVPGVSNGNLPLRYLASTDNGCVVYDEAVRSLNAMVAEAKKAGVTLRPTSCYRDYAGQVAVRADWCNKGACHMAAVPGTSNHGWGKAVDFADQKGILAFDSDAYAWLEGWAWAYGWYHPPSMKKDGPVPEAWHWEWIGDGGKMFPGEYFGIGNNAIGEPRGMPFGVVDFVQPVPGGVRVQGWAIDPDQVASIPVHVYVGHIGYPLMANQGRPDVNKAYPLFAGAQHGWSATLPAAPGTYSVCAYAINVSGTGDNKLLRCETVTVPPAVQAAAVPAPAPTAPVTTTAPPTTTAPSTTTIPSTTTVPAAPAQAGSSGIR